MQKMKVILASSNPGKLKEYYEIFKTVNMEIIPQSEFNIVDAKETGLTFIENAIIKARHACQYSGLSAISDDTGLIIDALNGKPGIYSARYAATSEERIEKVLQELKEVEEPKRTARFCCATVFLKNSEDPAPVIGQGIWEGRILFKPQGKNGFGYDPIFYVPEKNCSVAELSAGEKSQLGHRGKSIRDLLSQL